MKKAIATALLCFAAGVLTAAVFATERWTESMFREPSKRPRPSPSASVDSMEWLRGALRSPAPPRRREPVSYGADEVRVLRSRAR